MTGAVSPGTVSPDTVTPAALARPQPVGVFPLPAGFLLVGGDPGFDEARITLSAGRRPDVFPAGLGYYEAAIEGDVERALDALAGDDVIARANRFVLDPSPAMLDELLTIPALDPALRCHIETVAFTVGLLGEAPSPRSTDGEFAAMAHAARASLALEHHDRARAVEELERAAQLAHPVSKALAGQLLGQLADTQLDDGGVQRASVTFQAALDALADTDLHVSRAELHVAAGAMFQEMSEAAPRLMQQAINHYHQALALVDAEQAPEIFAVANANLGLAYLTMPMHEASDRLRMGVAVQSMRDALTVFTPATHPDRWSSTQLNLANALVYLPSTHQADNIAEAVGLYEGVLRHRGRDTDPRGRARVLANQGNALAHLGVFDDARPKLHEALAIFEECGEDDAARSVQGVLDEIAQHEAIRQESSRQHRP